jgi:outer membrane protein assembly factor BamA
MRTTWEMAPEALASDGGSGAVTFDVRGYRRAGWRHAAFGVRAAAASAWGDPETRRVFSASGAGPQTGDFNFGKDAVGLLRGLATDAVVGRHAVVGNLDYRFPLRHLERGVGTVPIFFRTIHAALFADAGHAWGDTFRWSETRTSAGAELSLDTVVAYALPLTFSTGVAWRNDPVGRQHGVAVFGRVGRAF